MYIEGASVKLKSIGTCTKEKAQSFMDYRKCMNASMQNVQTYLKSIELHVQ